MKIKRAHFYPFKYCLVLMQMFYKGLLNYFGQMSPKTYQQYNTVIIGDIRKPRKQENDYGILNKSM